MPDRHLGSIRAVQKRGVRRVQRRPTGRVTHPVPVKRQFSLASLLVFVLLTGFFMHLNMRPYGMTV